MNHKSFIHCIAYDHYGIRIGSCLSEQKIQILDLNYDTNKWEVSDTWEAHDGSIIKLDWAHPKHGQIVASCSLDNTVRIFEEQGIGKRENKWQWFERAKLKEANAGVYDISFSPIKHGLKIASVSADGYVRIYEAIDASNLAEWTLIANLKIHERNVEFTTPISTCIDWGKCHSGPAQLVVAYQNICKIYSQNKQGQWHVFKNIR